MDVLDELDRVFRLEIDTLIKVRDNLGESYSRAVQLLLECEGKVVVTGMGKSGFIGQKIAATLASTGTAAMFLHAGDGMHGDVGIVQKGDAVVAISKFGETAELLNILLYIRAIGVPVISVTANPESALAKASDIILFTPVDEEACPLNLAPTSSTTAALVVGDALAMTLMKRRGFTPEQFALLHPGGQLGRRLLLTVEDIMRSGENNPVIGIDMPLREMLVRITSFRVGAISIIDESGRLEGIVTDYDIRRALESGNDFLDLHISDVMNASPETILAEIKAIEALEMMRGFDKPIAVLPVVDSERRAIGMIHLHDLIAAGL